jgi:hypothetical protein
MARPGQLLNLLTAISFPSLTEDIETQLIELSANPETIPLFIEVIRGPHPDIVIHAAVLGLRRCIRLTSSVLTFESVQWIQSELLLALHRDPQLHHYDPSILQILKYLLKTCPKTSESVGRFILDGSGIEKGYFVIALPFARYSDNPGEITAHVRAKALELLLSGNATIAVQALRFLGWSSTEILIQFSEGFSMP